ncbi:MAG: ubiquinol-cytochrome c reductase iron-sulfur subunit [Gammaproteobacteria bacterium]|nr:ubiquinol-cytochrome c reductase iron-sulfur subunit [Gammaproteobacteria bacterium]
MAEKIDHSRRRLLTAATVGTGAIGVVFAAVPFLASWSPSARARALGAPVELDASKLEPGQMVKVAWRGQPIYVVRRTKDILEHLGDHNALLADPNSDASDQPAYIKASGAARARNPEYWVGLGVCTHLGCAPLGAFERRGEFQVAGVDLGKDWPGGFYCPCHGSKYDASGRVFKNVPAPKNLAIPPYAFGKDLRVVVGVDDASQNA